MNNRLRDLRLLHSLSSQQLVDVIRERYPKYDKPLQSKCEAPDIYGVELRRDALKDVYMKYDPEAWNRRNKDTGRKCRNRLYARLNDETFKRFKAKLEADGYGSVQECLTDLIFRYLNEKGAEDDDTDT